MKSQHYIIVLILLVFSFTQTVSAQTVKEQLIGTWSFDYESSKSKMDIEGKIHFSNMDATRKNRLESIYKNRTFIFLANGNYIQQSSNGRKVEGSWSLQRNTITITLSQGVEKILNIMQIDTKTMLIKPKSTASRGNLMFTQWYLTKN